MPAPWKTAPNGCCAITLSCEISSNGAFGFSPGGAVFARDPAEQWAGNRSDVIPPADML